MEAPGENDTHPALETPGDVRREMARLYRRIKGGHVDAKQANAMTLALNVLYGMHKDARDSRIAKQVRELWAEREKRGAAPHAEH